MWPLLSLTAFLEPEVRVERWVRTSVPAHPKGCFCWVYKGTTSPHTPSTTQGMVLSGLQRYYLSPHPYIPRDATVGFTKVLPLPTHPVHPKGWCCRVYKSTTSPHTPCTSQGMVLSGLQRYYLSPHTLYIPRDGAVGFTKVLPLPTHPVHPKGWCCRVYKSTTSSHTPCTSQGMVLSGLQKYYLSPHTLYIPRDGAVGFTKVLPLPTHPVHPKGWCCRVYKSTTSPHTPCTSQGMVLSGLQKYYLSPHTLYIPRDGAVGFTKVLPLPRHPLHPKAESIFPVSRTRDMAVGQWCLFSAVYLTTAYWSEKGVLSTLHWETDPLFSLTTIQLRM